MRLARGSDAILKISLFGGHELRDLVGASVADRDGSLPQVPLTYRLVGSAILKLGVRDKSATLAVVEDLQACSRSDVTWLQDRTMLVPLKIEMPARHFAGVIPRQTSSANNRPHGIDCTCRRDAYLAH